MSLKISDAHQKISFKLDVIVGLTKPNILILVTMAGMPCQKKKKKKKKEEEEQKKARQT